MTDTAGGRMLAGTVAGGAQAGEHVRIVRVDGAHRAVYDGTGATVLLADAHEDSRAMYATLLRHNGFAVLEAATGEEAIRLAHAHRPDAVVLEPVLRGVDGLRALEVLREHPATARIPVVVLSSVSGDEHEARARAAGCAAYLVKPCPPRRLLDAVRLLTERCEAA